MSKIYLMFNPSQRSRSGYWFCNGCGSYFSPDEPPKHRDGCKTENYIYIFGPREREIVRNLGLSPFCGSFLNAEALVGIQPHARVQVSP